MASRPLEQPVSNRPFAVITGASRGIGAAYARALFARGHDLLLVSRDKPRLEALATELKEQRESRVHLAVLDLAEPEAAHRLFVLSRELRLTPDVLINNAGFGLRGEFVEMSLPRLQAMVRLHIQTVVETVRLFLPGMVERGSGAIINVASVAGFYSIPYLTEYAATKAFLITFSEALAEEVRSKGVRIQACCPGSTDTDFHATAGFGPHSPFGSQDPASVVAVSLAKLAQGPAVITTRWSDQLFVWLSRFLPRGWVTRVAGRVVRPRRK